MFLPKARLFCSIVALGFVATSLAGAPAAAERNRKPVTLQFTYNAADSAETNYRNLLVKAKRACNYAHQGPLALGSPADEKACVQQMTDRAVAQIGKPDLMAAHQAATGAERRQLAAQ